MWRSIDCWPRPYTVTGYGVGASSRMSEFMAYTIDTRADDGKVMTFYIEECMKGAATRRARGVLALIRASCENQVRNSARAILMQAANVTQNMYNSLEAYMRALARAPGRKLAFFVSDGFLLDAGPHAAATRDKLDHVIDAAQRSGVVVYTIHAQGLVNSSFADPGNVRPMDGNGRLEIAAAGELHANQDALNALAGDTGGRALRNTNFFDKWLTTVLDETSNYYLVAWRPESDEERTPKFRHVKISVVGHPELSVRAPRGYVDGSKHTPTTAAVTEKRAENKTAGRYDLKVTITDILAGTTASQLADFIVR